MIHPERRRENLKKIEEMDREKKVIEGMEQFRADLKPFCGNHADWERFDAGLSMLKEQDAEIKRLKGELHGFGDLFHALSEKTKKVMEEQPDIVRCKECKHRSKELYDYYGNPNNKRYVCQIIDVAKKPDWFCGDGERGEPE